MFDIDFRTRATDRILAIVAHDQRITAGAVVGSLARTEGDRFSDIDLTFAVTGSAALQSVLDDWTALLSDEFDVDVLFDLPSGPSLYRVLLFPGALQVDLSVTAAPDFGARAETFRLLFGAAGAATVPARREVAEMAGYAVHHVLHTRTSIERGHSIQALYWLGELRNEALEVALTTGGHESSQARGAHRLPASLVAHTERTLARSLDRDELDRALSHGIDLLEFVTEPIKALSPSVLMQLEGLRTFRSTAPIS